jgi:arginine utilization protein RocB
VLLPPYYPPAPPGDGPLVRAARDVLGAAGVAVNAWYPFISDASYLAWRERGADALAAHLPALGREYRLPAEDIASLDLDVVNLGPWGRDAHGLHERVRCDWTFERLPGLVAAIVRAALAR